MTGIDFDKLLNCTREVMVEIGEEKLTVLYRPNAYTPDLEKRAAAAQTGAFAGGMLITMLAPVLASWDLKSKGKALPTDEETLQRVPLQILTKVLEAIAADMNPQTASSSASKGSF